MDEQRPENANARSSRSVLSTALHVTSTAATVAAMPYVIAGRVAMDATSMALAAPKRVVRMLRPSNADTTPDLFGEQTVDNEAVIEQELEPIPRPLPSDSAMQQLVLRPVLSVTSNVAQTAASTAMQTSALVARGAVHSVFTAFSMAHNALPPGVAQAVRDGLLRTGTLSTRVLATALAVPTYRLAHTLMPQVETLVTEEQCVQSTYDAIMLLVRVLGPQNAFIVLQRIYDAMNSPQAHRTYLLCQDAVRDVRGLPIENDTPDRKARRRAVRGLVEVLPSFEEVVDMFAFAKDVGNELIDFLGLGEDEYEDELEFEFDLDDRFEEWDEVNKAEGAGVVATTVFEHSNSVGEAAQSTSVAATDSSWSTGSDTPPAPESTASNAPCFSEETFVGSPQEHPASHPASPPTAACFTDDAFVGSTADDIPVAEAAENDWMDVANAVANSREVIAFVDALGNAWEAFVS